MPWKTIIYGSGAEEGRDKLDEAKQKENAESKFTLAQQLASNPLTAPLAPLALIAATLQSGSALGGPMAARDFTPYGELVPKIGTKTLNDQNIFG
jgi:hypothetical protein